MEQVVPSQRDELARHVGGGSYVAFVLARYRYRIEPTLAQRRDLAKVFGCCRVVFNDALRTREAAYRAGLKLSDSEVQRSAITVAKTTAERHWLVEVPSVALVQSVNDARQAYRSFFDCCSARRKGRKIGHPRMKSKKDQRQSFRLTRNGFRVRSDGLLKIAKVGDVRVRWSRRLPSEPSSVTIIREPDGRFHASFVVEVPATPLPAVARESGVDMGIVRMATIADTQGRRKDVSNPKHLQRKLRKLRRLEREKSRRQKGSNNREKSRRKVAIAHGAVARARRDYHHKQALALVRDSQVIHVEDLHVAGMIKNRRLGRAISDAGWAQFVRIIAHKCEKYGRTQHRVSRWLPSSKTCSGCGYVMGQLPLHVRQWTCPMCRRTHDRDYNAAKNILAAGRAERQNASHASGRDRLGSSGGAPVSPRPDEARGDEAGSSPAAV
jgi:putative transposase